MKNLFGRIDLTKLSQLLLADPSIKKAYVDKMGKTHEYIDIDICERKTPSEFGDVAFIKVAPREKKDGVNYYLADLKVSKFQDDGNQAQTQTEQSAPFAQAVQPTPVVKAPIFGESVPQQAEEQGELPF